MEHQISSRLDGVWETTCHGEEQTQPLAQAPYRLTWGALHQAHLPLEEQLGYRFKLTTIRFEELVFALGGGRPIYDANPPRQWYERGHPRCLWGPEQWQSPSQVNHPQFGSGAWDYFRETAAFGSVYRGARPQVPVRSRSGDPNFQYQRARHDPRFALGSVQRSAGNEVWDHNSTSYVAAPMNPLPAEDVTIVYTPPGGAQPQSVVLVTNLGEFPMALGPEGYSVTVPARAQDEVLIWYLRGRFVVPGSDPPEYEDVYEPLGEAGGPPELNEPPADEHLRGEYDAYTLVWCSHYNPYAGGLPEFMYWHPEHRKNVDEYRFDGSETVQAPLLNLMRFVLDWLGRRLHHPPHWRGDPAACCFYMPITWRWSGSNWIPHYRGGGKGGADGVHPLHDGPAEVEAGTSAARFSWRGLPMLFKEKDPRYYDNFWYGDDCSWETFRERVMAEIGRDDEWPNGNWYEDGSRAGLQGGDAIDPNQIEELIAAIDYLVDGGCWIPYPYYSRKLTPGTYRGQTCGDVENWHYYSEEGGTPQEWYTYHHWHCLECCLDCYDDPVPPGENGWCIPHPQPESWEECVEGGPHERCLLAYRREAHCYGRAHSEDPFWGWILSRDASKYVDCDAQGWTYAGCGHSSDGIWCNLVEGQLPRIKYRDISEEVNGWARWICGPPQCPDGPDGLHGNSLKKERYTHDWHPQLVDTGPSMGNCFGDLKSCAEFVGSPGQELGFQTVSPQRFDGMALSWQPGRDCSPSAPPPCGPDEIEPYPDLPGFGHYHWGSTVPLCELAHGAIGSPPPAKETWTWDCTCSTFEFPICRGEELWVAVNLNLDGSGVPYSSYVEGYNGLRIPKLRDYDLDPPEGYPEPVSDCPCDTALEDGC